MKNIKEVAFQASTIHPGSIFYIANALKDDQPINEGGYLVMVNERGDRVAFCVPGGEWEVDAILLSKYNSKIPNYVNAIRVLPSSLENV